MILSVFSPVSPEVYNIILNSYFINRYLSCDLCTLLSISRMNIYLRGAELRRRNSIIVGFFRIFCLNAENKSYSLYIWIMWSITDATDTSKVSPLFVGN